MTTTLADVFGDYRFFGSRDGDVKLNRLRRDFQLADKWQVARLAIASSLAAAGAPPPPPDRDGSEIRGITLFKRDGTGPALAGLVVNHAERPLEPGEIAEQIEAHWDRGLQILNDRVEEALAAGRDADSVLVAMAQEAALTSNGEQPKRSQHDGLLEERIVGQAAAKRIVMPILRDALASDPIRLEGTLLFTGPASTGKTVFSQVIASSLDLPFVDTNGSVTRSITDLLARIETACAEAGSKKEKTGTRGGIPIHRYPPSVVFIDECHAMPRSTQTELLTAMEPTQREAKTNEEIADISQVTILFATTDSTKLLEPLRTRTREIVLEPYARAEVAEIIHRAHSSWPSTVCQALAVAGRLIPRQALTVAEDFDRFLRQEYPDERCSEQLALRFMHAREMDELGLVPRDYRYLDLLPKDRSPNGLQAIASQLHLEESEVEDGIEPFLIQLRLVERKARGRQITAQGLELLQVNAD